MRDEEHIKPPVRLLLPCRDAVSMTTLAQVSEGARESRSPTAHNTKSTKASVLLIPECSPKNLSADIDSQFSVSLGRPHDLEARGFTEPEVLNVPNTVQLPGAPRDPAMMEARKELVERVINASLDIFLEKSQEAIIAAIFTSQRMQNALRAFELSRGVQLPTDDELGLLSRIVLAEWRRHLFNLTARYHAIITRNAHGFKTEEKERSEFWSSELPPPPLPWTFWTALLHVFCLVSTIGGCESSLDKR
ncbi:uncharacterized protein LOC134777192 [Penaeus indicus]|uniref:uncharacterized protein LOC134777192 n=1 Tax=Penaeus indicus TaxID=29960 RepID=UPI00300CA3FF